MIDNIEVLKAQQEDLLRRMNNLSCEQPVMQYNDVYSTIESAASKLTDTDRNDLLNDCEYQKMISELNTYIQQETFRLIRNNLNSNQNATNVMKQIADYIIKFKNENDNKKSAMLNDFNLYISKYSDMTYDEFLKNIKHIS